MSILDEHFDRVQEYEGRGIQMVRGVFYDAVGTLVDFDEIPEVTDFARWVKEQGLFKQQVVFSTRVGQAENLFQANSMDVTDFGVDRVEGKALIYQQAGRALLELVIDDKPLNSDGQVTHWNPNDDRVKAFLEARAYRHYHPQAA